MTDREERNLAEIYTDHIRQAHSTIPVQSGSSRTFLAVEAPSLYLVRYMTVDGLVHLREFETLEDAIIFEGVLATEGAN